MKKILYPLTVLAFALAIAHEAYGQTGKPRLIVLTDISYFEPDDMQSMIRLLLYSNQIEIEGLIATTSEFRMNIVEPELIRQTIAGYAKVQPNLLKHEPGFPAPEALQATIKAGLPLYGMEGVGAGYDSEGSEWIIATLEKNDDRPLWINVWGGSTVLAQSLWKIRETKSPEEAQRLVGKLRVYAISDQDDSGAWIRNSFPELFYIASPGKYENGTWTAIMKVMPEANNDVISNFWIAKNIQQGHGALGSAYPSAVFGVEGDSPSFLYLVDNGLNSPGHPDWGSWGGRYELKIPPFNPDPSPNTKIPMIPETRPIWTDATDRYTPIVEAKFGRSIVSDTITCADNYVTLWRWREDFQNDFAARMDWCVNSYEQANHPPVVKLNGFDRITVESGTRFELDASLTYDPDGDGLIYYWFNYPEAGSCDKPASLFPPNIVKPMVLAPDVETPQTVHFILKVTDRGTPRLTRYKRIVVDVIPKENQ
jgi:hypothetical protein